MRSSFSIAIVLGMAIASTAGCSNLFKSRYAMDDPVYAAKYEEGAPKSQPLVKLKQSMDARYVEGLEGGYFSGGTQWRDNSQSTLAGAEIGSENYFTSWSSGRVAFAGYIGPDDWYAGLDTGLRFQLPTRLTPFVGVGSFHGLSTTYADSTDDGLDNDDDGAIDEVGELDIEFDGWLSAVYPEVGVHFWATGHGRLTGFARYLITTDGRDTDDWLAGVQFTAFGR